MCSSHPCGWGQDSGPRVTEPRDWDPTGDGPVAALHSVCCGHTATRVTGHPGKGSAGERQATVPSGCIAKATAHHISHMPLVRSKSLGWPTFTGGRLHKGRRPRRLASLGPLSQLLPQWTVQQPGVPRSLLSRTSSTYFPPDPDTHLSDLPSQTELSDQPQVSTWCHWPCADVPCTTREENFSRRSELSDSADECHQAFVGQHPAHGSASGAAAGEWRWRARAAEPVSA